MRFVDDHQIPRNRRRAVAGARRVRRRVACEGRYDLRRRAPEIPTPRVRFGDVALQPNVEHVLQAKLPLWHQLRRVRMRSRRTRPAAIKGISTRPHSMVLPSPTSSATSHRNGHSRFTVRQTHS